MSSLDDGLDGARRVGLDTGPLIYLVESHPDFEAVPIELVERAAAGRINLVTSAITLTELLVVPLRQGAYELVREYRDILLSSGQIEVIALDSEIAEQAAALRAKYLGLRTPDAIHLATAITSDCDVFITSDKRLRNVSEISVLYLNELSV